MNRIGIRPTPLGVTLIGAFYLFGAVVLLVTTFTNPAGATRVIAEGHGLSPTVGRAILPVVAVLAVVIAYGLLTLSRWGFFLTIAYLLYFGAVGLVQGGLGFASTGEPQSTLYLGNIVWSAMVICYLILTRRHFLAPKTERRGPDPDSL